VKGVLADPAAETEWAAAGHQQYIEELTEDFLALRGHVKVALAHFRFVSAAHATGAA